MAQRSVHPVVATLIDAVGAHDLERVSPDALLDSRVAATPVDDVLDIADAHRVAPALARYLSALDGVPEPLLEALLPQRTQQRLRHLTTLADLGPLAQALDSARICWVVLKGPVAATALWPSPDMRGYLDLDVLVEPARFAETIDILRDLGAEQVDLNWGLALRQMRAELTFVLPHGTILDLHWHPVNEASVRGVLDWPVDDLLGRRRLVTIGSLEAPTLDPVDTLLHMAYHAGHSGAHRVLWLKDVECAWAAVDDPDEVVRRAEAARLDVLVRAVLDRTALVLGTDRCPPISWRSRRGALWRRLLRAYDARGEVPPVGVDGRTHRSLFTSTRTSTARSVGSLVAAGAGHVWYRRDAGSGQVWYRRADPDAYVNPLHVADDDEQARTDYLAAVAEQGGTRSGARSAHRTGPGAGTGGPNG